MRRKNPDKLKVKKNRKLGIYLLTWNGWVLRDIRDNPLVYFTRNDAKQSAKVLEKERAKNQNTGSLSKRVDLNSFFVISELR